LRRDHKREVVELVREDDETIGSLLSDLTASTIRRCVAPGKSMPGGV
jgi:hypothetical protein